jgi:hypothetical protein
MARLLCLANAFRPGGRCIAGIDLDTGLWVRPVQKTKDEIPEQRVYIDGTLIELGHIVEMAYSSPPAPTRFQRENVHLNDWNWRLAGRMEPKAIMRYCDATAPILHNLDDRVDPQLLDPLPAEQWQSLQLVHVRDVRFGADPHAAGKFRASFKDVAGNQYTLRLTDPVAAERLTFGEKLRPECLLTVSLTRPFSPDGRKAAVCYKLVAAVIEL